MRFLLSIFFTAILAAAAEFLLPWWTIAVAAAIVSLLTGYRAGKSFLMGFLGIAILWGIVILLRDLPNDHILSNRMVMLFPLPHHYSAFALVTILVGGLIGGMAAWGAALLKQPTR